jgi:hypothetical protein
MGEVAVFPQCRVVRSLTRSPRIEELELRILEHLRILRHRNTDEIVGEILRLRDEIWRTEAEEAGTPSVELGWPQGSKHRMKRPTANCRWPAGP